MRPAALNDPMELVGVALPEGEADCMAECLIEEYLWLGWDEQKLLILFKRPCFRATHRIYRDKGEAYVRALIRRVQDKWRPRHAPGGDQDA